MKLPCYLVRELLPLYHDKVLGEQAAADVKEHLTPAPTTRYLRVDALDAGTGAEQALAAEQQQTEPPRCGRSRARAAQKTVGPAVAVAVAIFAALFVFSRALHAAGRNTQLEPEEIRSVEVEQPVYTRYLRVWRTFEITDGDGSKKALAVSLQVSRWNELFHNGRTEWRIEDVDPDVTEIYYFKSEDQLLIDEEITQQEDGTWAAEQIPEELHLLWRRGDDADAPPATPEAAVSETDTPESAGR